MAQLIFGMGCFWGAERRMWQLDGVEATEVGYAGGTTEAPSYEAVCGGHTGHAEVVKVIFDPTQIELGQLLNVFWESHDPTQGNRQGNDIGTQYRSVIYCESEADYAIALESRDAYQRNLTARGLGAITTEIKYPAPRYYAAEEYHQKYLLKNPNGYCGLRGTGVPA